MAKASSAMMDRLHNSVAVLLTEELARAAHAAAQPRKVTIQTETGPAEIPNVEFAPINPQLIDKVLKFLKDNGIDSPEKSAVMSSLVATLDNLDLDQAAFDRPN